MSTVQAPNAVQPRLDLGNAIIQAATTISTKPIAKKLATFTKAHKDYSLAASATTTAEQKLRKAQELVGECDVDQDEAGDKLASALVGDGLPRANPFKDFGAEAPSNLYKLPHEKEAAALHKLVKAVKKRKGLSKATLSAATLVDKAATSVEEAAAKIKPLQTAYQACITRREALAMPWEKAFSSLKRAARTAEDDGATGLFEALFQRTAKPAAPKAKKAAKASAAAK